MSLYAAHSRNIVSSCAAFSIRSNPRKIARSKRCSTTLKPLIKSEVMRSNKPGASGVPMSAFPIQGINFKKIHLGRTQNIPYFGTEIIKNAFRATVLIDFPTFVRVDKFPALPAFVSKHQITH